MSQIATAVAPRPMAQTHQRGRQYSDLCVPALVDKAVHNDEGMLSKDGAFMVAIDKHTEHSSSDTFTVRDTATEDAMWWGRNNQPMAPEHFGKLKSDFFAHLRSLDAHYVQHLFAGSQQEYRVGFKVITELAWHSLFIRTLLVHPSEVERTTFICDYTIIDLPSFRAALASHGCRSEAVVAVNVTEKLILIGGTANADEIKKAVFRTLNFLLPTKGVMPMQCSANIGAEGDAALLFGGTGRGNATLLADTNRMLIGEDELGWSDTAIFNFDGGCYAKVSRLTAEAEQEIVASKPSFETMLDNVVFNSETRVTGLDDNGFDDDSLAETNFSSHPLHFIPNACVNNLGPVPENIIFLTNDAYGVLPPIAKLTPDQAMYYFLSGYTARIASPEFLGTQISVTEPSASFSTCFGAPSIPRHPSVYGNLLKQRIAKGGVKCWLVNTGWTGGSYDTGWPMPIEVTRKLLNAALKGQLDRVTCRIDPIFRFQVPVTAPGVDAALLDPRSTWADSASYDKMARKLASLFVSNFVQFEPFVDGAVASAGPRIA